MANSWKRVNYSDEIKIPYKKEKNDKLRNLKGLSLYELNEYDIEDYEDEEGS